MSKYKKINWKLANIMALVAGLLYYTWPLGYYLNPKVSAHGLASELAAKGQPYNWVFVLGDVLAGVSVVIIAFLLSRWLKRQRQYAWLKIALVGYAFFGLFTAIDALMPMHCVPSLSQCANFRVDHLLLFHGIASIAAAVFLGVSVFAVWYASRANNYGKIMGIIMLGWAFFGVASLALLFLPKDSNAMQHYFITLCSVCIALLPLVALQTNKLAYARK